MSPISSANCKWPTGHRPLFGRERPAWDMTGQLCGEKTGMYKHILRPLLGKLDSETWHVRAREALHFAESTPLTIKLLEQCAYQRKQFCNERLRVVMSGVTFENP